MRLREVRSFFLSSMALFGFFPLYGVAVTLLVGEENGPLILVLCAPYVAFFVYRGLRSWSIDCPRCGQYFFRRGTWFGWPTHCNHCGLSLFESYDDD